MKYFFMCFLMYLLIIGCAGENGVMGPQGEQGEQGEPGPGEIIVKIGTLNSVVQTTSGWKITFLKSSEVTDSAATLLYIRSSSSDPWLDANAFNFMVAPNMGFTSISVSWLKESVTIYDSDHNLAGNQYKIVFIKM